MDNNQNKEKVEEIIHEIIFGTRKSKVEVILKYSTGEMFETKQDWVELATSEDVQLNKRLQEIAVYYLNEIGRETPDLFQMMGIASEKIKLDF